MDTQLVKAFIAECKQEQEWKERWEANHIDFNNYFKYSGEVEPTQILISHYKYDDDRRCNILSEKFIKREYYEKNTKDTGGLYKGSDSNYWEEANDGIWRD
jgi:hypothetical protein